MALVGNAHLVAGDATMIPEVISLLEKEGLATEGSADVYARSYAHFGVEEAREIRERAALKAAGSRRSFVLAAPTMTTEAQNALLKTLEDAPGDALFFLIVPSPSTLLPTVRSRSQIIDLAQDRSADVQIDTGAFLSSSPQMRLDMLKPLLEKGDDDRRDMASIITFLSSLERKLAAEASRDATKEGLTAIYRARAYILDKGSLVKPLLESVALLVPIMKA